MLGCLVEFYRNRRRHLDWYTVLLVASPSHTVLVARLGARRTVVTANPANVVHLLKANFGNYPKGKPFMDVLGDLLDDGIFNANGEPWHAQRKLMSHEFTARALREQVGSAQEAGARAARAGTRSGRGERRGGLGPGGPTTIRVQRHLRGVTRHGPRRRDGIAAVEAGSGVRRRGCDRRQAGTAPMAAVWIKIMNSPLFNK